jgi:hypothetical protein
MREPKYELQEVTAIPPKAFSAYERDGFEIYAMSKMRDVVTLKLRRVIGKEGKK